MSGPDLLCEHADRNIRRFLTRKLSLSKEICGRYLAFYIFFFYIGASLFILLFIFCVEKKNFVFNIVSVTLETILTVTCETLLAVLER